MKIVIDIDDEQMLSAIKNRALGAESKFDKVIINALYNGTPLPKHGRLIDVDDIRVIELEDSLHIIRYEKGNEVDVYIDAPTIIEADTTESEDN